MNPVKVKDLEELKVKASDRFICIFILLQFGIRSSKDISYSTEKKLWSIYNNIDDTEQVLNDKELEEDTSIIKALNNNALFYYKNYD
jgi:hypothetical protein